MAEWQVTETLPTESDRRTKVGCGRGPAKTNVQTDPRLEQMLGHYSESPRIRSLTGHSAPVNIASSAESR